MTESEFREKYYSKVKDQTVKTLPAFIQEMFKEDLDYGSACCAVAASALAAAWAANHEPQGNISGFQAGAVMWEFVQQWNYRSNKCGLQMIDYDNLLYPQYAEKFNNTIPPNQWATIQKEAQDKLDSQKLACTEVKAHWQSIIDGKLPHGFTLETE